MQVKLPNTLIMVYWIILHHVLEIIETKVSEKGSLER